MKKGFFITGTDTGVGKTLIACALLSTLQKQNYTAAALKPLASGCEETPAGLRNEDALLLQQYQTENLPYEIVNPIAFKEPIAPHIAAAAINENLSVAKLLKHSQPLLNTHADYTIVEGAGGWLMPLNEKETLADFANALNFPVILVVGIRLGCLNHTLLTYQSITKTLPVAGWVANCIAPETLCLQENITSLQQFIPAPFLGTVPFMSEVSVEHSAEYLESIGNITL